jgi:hypothetical protein
MRLDPDDIEAVAARVVALLREGAEAAPRRLVDADALAQILGVSRDWVYARATRLGALRLGDGPKPPLRFDVARVLAALAPSDGGQARPADPPPRRRARAKPRSLPPGVRPVRARPSG